VKRASSILAILALLLALPSCGRTHHPSTEPSAARTVPVVKLRPIGPRSDFVELSRAHGTPPSTPGLPDMDLRVNQDLTARFQNETAGAADPNNTQHLVAAWNDNLIFDPSIQLQVTTVAYGSSQDGGATWHSDRIQFDSLAPEQNTADPSITVDGLGNVYLGFLPYNQFDRADPDTNQVLVAKSIDGGVSYSEPVPVDSGAMDRPFITSDPSSNAVYVTWVELAGSIRTIRFSKSTDQGINYSPPVAVSSAASEGTGPIPVVGPSGDVLVVWGNQDDQVWFDRSLDGGSTWLATDVLVNGDIVKPRSPLLGGFRNPAFPALAVDRTAGPFAGRFYVIWPDQRFGDPDVLLAFSDDQGDTWSAPVRVNDDARSNDADQFFPWVVVDGSGHVQVTFLDRRDDPEGVNIALYLATSTNGGASFGPNIRVSDGAFPPSDFFFGDYTGTVTVGGHLFPFWPDARLGEQDVLTRGVELTDFDEDGLLNDGDLDGQYASNRCTGGQTTWCDDNCPGVPNADQTDQDGDRVGDACDNCPATPNTRQSDGDRDGSGDLCDACPGAIGADGGDNDTDGVINCADNCPDTPNDDQTDSDLDEVGDSCDPCPGDAVNDPDGDDICASVDNCPTISNALQADADGDMVGNLCDSCPYDSDPGQQDADGDGVGDACDCQPPDPNDRQPGEVSGIRVFRTSSGVRIAWRPTGVEDVYSVSRGLISSLDSGSYGDCLIEGIGSEGFEDTGSFPPGEGFFYLIQAQHFGCPLGTLGFTSSEEERINGNAGTCQGLPHTDVYADSEESIFGSVSGSLAGTLASDNVLEQLTEETTGGNPADRFTRLEHRWTFQVPGGSKVELHDESFHTVSADNDDFVFEYSTDGTNFTTITNQTRIAFVPDADVVFRLPDALSGTVIIRVVDTMRQPGPGATSQDTISIDELFIRSIP
jgi:hypothetical protein